jgi:hypothetical protein
MNFMKLCVMAAVQGYAVHPAADSPCVCHSLTAQEISSPTCFGPYESITHTHLISRGLLEYYLPVCVKIFNISNYTPVLEFLVVC